MKTKPNYKHVFVITSGSMKIPVIQWPELPLSDALIQN
jgi:hypothetical protein